MNGCATASVMLHELFYEYINKHQHILGEMSRMQAHADASAIFLSKIIIAEFIVCEFIKYLLQHFLKKINTIQEIITNKNSTTMA